MSECQKIFYSASCGGFFSPAVHTSLPDDAVRITSTRHAALLAGQADGHEIIPDRRGRPHLRSLGPATIGEALSACVHEIKREAARRIDARMPLWRQLNAVRDGTDPGFHQIDAIRAASNLIESHIASLDDIAAVLAFDVRACTLWPEFAEGDENHA